MSWASLSSTSVRRGEQRSHRMHRPPIPRVGRSTSRLRMLRHLRSSIERPVMNAIVRPSKPLWLTFDQINFPANARPTNATDVGALVRSIRTIGLQVPLTVIERDGRYVLIAGRHRLEALRVIGEERVPARVVDFDDIEARLWTISENLHRTELSAVHRSEQIAEFARLVKERQEGAQLGEKVPPTAHEGVSAQVAQKPQGGRPEGGDSLAARELGITREEVRRS